MTNGLVIQTNEVEDVLGSIRHAARCSEIVSEDPHAWKWGILALHSALQGACVCHLATTAAPLGTVTPANAREWTSYFESSRDNPEMQPPQTRLMALPDLLKAVRKQGSAFGTVKNRPVRLSDAELSRLQRFHNEIRNQFVHFEPMEWCIEVSGIPNLGSLIARIIKDIDSIGWAFRHLDDEQKDVLIVNLKQLAEAKWLPSF